MKINIYLLHIKTAIVLMIVLSILNKACAVDDGRISFATYSYPPYVYAQDVNIQGEAVEKVKCTLAQLNKPYKLILENRLFGYLGLVTGKEDAFFPIRMTDDLSKYGKMTEEIMSMKLKWFFPKDKNYEINSNAKKELKFATVYGTPTWFELKRQGYNLVKKPNNTNELITLLKNKEVNVVIENDASFKLIMKSKGEPEDLFNSRFYKNVGLGVYFSNEFLMKTPDFLQDFNSALVACRD